MKVWKRMHRLQIMSFFPFVFKKPTGTTASPNRGQLAPSSLCLWSAPPTSCTGGSPATKSAFKVLNKHTRYSFIVLPLITITSFLNYTAYLAIVEGIIVCIRSAIELVWKLSDIHDVCVWTFLKVRDWCWFVAPLFNITLQRFHWKSLINKLVKNWQNHLNQTCMNTYTCKKTSKTLSASWFHYPSELISLPWKMHYRNP